MHAPEELGGAQAALCAQKHSDSSFLQPSPQHSKVITQADSVNCTKWAVHSGQGLHLFLQRYLEEEPVYLIKHHVTLGIED